MDRKCRNYFPNTWDQGCSSVRNLGRNSDMTTSDDAIDKNKEDYGPSKSATIEI